MLVKISKSAYDASKTYGQKEAFDVLGQCSCELAELCDENGNPSMDKDNEPMVNFIWLSAKGTIWLRANWSVANKVL